MVLPYLISAAIAAGLIKKAHDEQEVRVIVKYKEKDKPLSYTRLQVEDDLIQKEKIVEKHDGTIIKDLPIIDGSVAIVKRKDIKKLREDVDIEYVEIDQPVYPLEVILQENIIPFSENVTWAVERVNALEYHQITKGNGIKVAVIDTGVNINHPDLINNIKDGYNLIDNSYDVYDDCDHGTCVAGLIAAENNDFGMLGIAPESFIYPLKVMRIQSDGRCSGRSSDVVQAIEWSIDNNMDIINMSLGSTLPVYSVKIALNKAYDAGILIVVAAGNNGSKSICDDNDCVSYPAAYDNAIAVSGVSINDTFLSYSSSGPQVEFAAPGSSIYTTASNGEYRRFSGTSCAAPIISGVAALLMATYSEKTNVEIREKLIEISEDLGEEGRDVLYGYGIPVLSLDEEPECIPNWQCEIPLNRYEADGCGNRRYNEACKPECIPNWQCRQPLDGCETDINNCGEADRYNTDCEPEVPEPEPVVIESPHPYPCYYDNTWNFEETGATSIRVHFLVIDTEKDFDYVYLYDKNDNEIARYDGIHNDLWSQWINGNIVKIKLVSDKCINKYGFKIDNIEVGLDEEPECIPNWQCEIPLNRYEADGCGNRRYNVDCEPITEIIAESPHPYLPSYRNKWVVERPGANKIRLHFSKIEMTIFDSLTVNWSYYREKPVEGWTQWYVTDKVEISLISSYNGGNAFGFVVDKAEYM